MIKFLSIFFGLLLITSSSYSQSYLDNFTGIPIITFGWTTNDYWLHDYDYNKIKEMGTDILVAPDLLYTKFDVFRLANLKLIPYQTSTTYTRANLIAKYTDAVYSVWEAENVPISQGEIQLSRDLTRVDEIQGVGVKTKNNNPGYIITGPNYIQPVKYSIDVPVGGDGLITYHVKFKLKVEPNGSPVPLINNTDNICRIEVTSGGTPLASSIIQAKQFINYGAWNQFELTYSYNNNASMKTNHPLQTSYLLNGTQNTEIEIFSNVEFKIYYYGTPTNYLNLYVDNILVYDTRGELLFTDPIFQGDIIEQANNTDNVNNITISQSDFDNTVVGWYPADEASFIDQWACVKKIAELIKNNTNGKKLVASIAGNWNGRVIKKMLLTK